MSGTHRTFGPGESTVFSTRLIGPTLLFIGPDIGHGVPEVTWHVELCCQPDRPVDGFVTTISALVAGGALVTVTNRARRVLQAWTDYDFNW